jgi:hypothetical protein
VASTERSDRITFVVGAMLLALYVVQGWLGLELPVLVRVQQHDTYKVISGCVLAGYLLHQALMARRRVFDPVGAVAWHKLAGACAPIVLYLHASRFAYGYLVLLSFCFVGTIGLGLLHRPVVRSHVRWLYTWWFVLHIATSASLLVLAGYHAVIALAYE